MMVSPSVERFRKVAQEAALKSCRMSFQERSSQCQAASLVPWGLRHLSKEQLMLNLSYQNNTHARAHCGEGQGEEDPQVPGLARARGGRPQQGSGGPAAGTPSGLALGGPGSMGRAAPGRTRPAGQNLQVKHKKNDWGFTSFFPILWYSCGFPFFEFQSVSFTMHHVIYCNCNFSSTIPLKIALMSPVQSDLLRSGLEV